MVLELNWKRLPRVTVPSRMAFGGGESKQRPGEAQVVYFYSAVYVSLPWPLDKGLESGISGEGLQ